MGGAKSDIVLWKNEKRVDGRALEDMRPLTIKAGVLKRADGSCYLEQGNNKVLAAVYGPRECVPKHAQDALKARLVYRYNMAPFSTDDRKRPGPDRRSTEISKVSREAFERVVFLEYFPKTSIDVYVEVLQADAGTRCAALNAASVALADAGIPMRDLLAACAAGRIADDVIACDMDQPEDNYGFADVPIAISPRTGEVHLLQMDGKLTREQFQRSLELATQGCLKIYEAQKAALKERYAGISQAANTE